MTMNKALFESGQVTIEATIQNCRFSWPTSADSVLEGFPTGISLSSRYDGIVDTDDLSWHSFDFTATPSWEGMTIGGSCSITLSIHSAGADEDADEDKDADADEDEDEDEDEDDDADEEDERAALMDELPDALTEAAEWVAQEFSVSDSALGEVMGGTPSVSVSVSDDSATITIDLPTTLYPWAETLGSLDDGISSSCDLSKVPETVRRLLDVSSNDLAWDSIDISDEADDYGIGYSATATVTIPLRGAMDEDDEEALREALDDCYASLLMSISGAEYECDDGGWVSVSVEQEFIEPEENEEEEDAED